MVRLCYTIEKMGCGAEVNMKRYGKRHRTRVFELRVMALSPWWVDRGPIDTVHAQNDSDDRELCKT